MSDTEHTAAPWKFVAEIPENGPYRAICGANGQHVTDFVHERDAALIAAAPELLEWLKWSIQFAEGFARDHNNGPTMASCIGQAKAAIAKAEAGAK